MLWSDHVVEIMLWYPTSWCGEAPIVVVCGMHGPLNIYTYIYNTNPTGNTSWWNIYVYKISIKVKLYHGETWACGPWYPLSSYIYIFVTWTHFPISMYIYIYIYIYTYMLTHVLLIYSFFSNLFFQERKKLTFFEHVSAFIICRDEFILGNLI